MDEMRDRLIEIIKEFEKQFFKEKVTEHHATLENEHENRLADKLLAAGVILPKFKIGQEVWHLIADSNNSFYIEDGWQYIAENKDKAVLCYPKEKGCRSKKIKRKDWVFATEAEARAALEEIE